MIRIIKGRKHARRKKLLRTNEISKDFGPTVDSAERGKLQLIEAISVPDTFLG